MKLCKIHIFFHIKNNQSDTLKYKKYIINSIKLLIGGEKGPYWLESVNIKKNFIILFGAAIALCSHNWYRNVTVYTKTCSSI